MAQVITTKTTDNSNKSYRTYGKKAEKEKKPLFRMTNYILMIIGVVILFVGYVLLTGGGSDDPNQFNEAIFNTRRLVVAPITILFGLVLEIVAIMWRTPVRKKDNEPPTEA